MKLLPITLSFLAISAARGVPFFSDRPPHLDTGVVACDDSSTWAGFGWQTVPGLDYVVERSDNLVDWSFEGLVQGMGQQEVILMKELPMVDTSNAVAAPAPAAGAINARLLMRPAWQGAGIVLSWNSLDDGKPTLH